MEENGIPVPEVRPEVRTVTADEWREWSERRVLEVTRELQGKNEVAFQGGKRQKDGTMSIRYSETVQSSTTVDGVDVFDEFQINIPIFYGGESVRMTCLFRFRIAAGAIKLFYVIHEKEELEQLAFEQIVNVVRDGVAGVPVVLGTK